mgnify:CR=1 FL=1
MLQSFDAVTKVTSSSEFAPKPTMLELPFPRFCLRPFFLPFFPLDFLAAVFGAGAADAFAGKSAAFSWLPAFESHRPQAAKCTCAANVD